MWHFPPVNTGPLRGASARFKNKTVPLKSGLVCTVKIITDRMKVLPYVWEKIR